MPTDSRKRRPSPRKRPAPASARASSTNQPDAAIASPPPARKKRFNVTSRSRPGLGPFAAQRIDSFVAAREEAEEVKRTPAGRRVVEMSDAEARLLRQTNPDLLITEDQPIELFKPPGYPATLSLDGTFNLTVTVTDEATGEPVPDVSVYGIGEAGSYKAVTDPNGVAALAALEEYLTRVVASPRQDYWSRIVPEVETSVGQLDIALRPLSPVGSYTWGHRLMGFDKVNRRWRGKGVRVAVIDSGIAADNDDLRPAGGRNVLDGNPPSTWNLDEKGHGTHCAGIIACRHNASGISGGAPDAEIYSLKVFPGGAVSDIIEAIEWCIINRMDVVSMSLGAPNPDPALEQVLHDAHERGITLVAAAGNDRTRVAYPAAYDTVIAVSAIGRLGTFPEDSDHTTKIGADRDWYGGLFAAGFTNFGPEIGVCAPGVAIVSTVPGGYTAWDGTSMACPMVSALAALIVEAHPALRTRDRRQPALVRDILYRSCLDLGMPPFIQGRGLPVAANALPAASPR